jgi:hypothetical protein
MRNTQDNRNEEITEDDSVLIQFSTKTTKALCAGQAEEK